MKGKGLEVLTSCSPKNNGVHTPAIHKKNGENQTSVHSDVYYQQFPTTHSSSPPNQCLVFIRCFLLNFKKLQKFDWQKACRKKTKN